MMVHRGPLIAELTKKNHILTINDYVYMKSETEVLTFIFVNLLEAVFTSPFVELCSVSY